jgi:hypothetical protein
MTVDEIINEATEAVEKNFNAGCYAGDLLRIIKEKNAEIEKLNVDLVGMRGACESYKMHYDNAQAEIERLRKETKMTIDSIRKLAVESIESAKSEAYREFWVKLRNHGHKITGSDWSGEFCAIAILVEDGDELLKELTESNE